MAAFDHRGSFARALAGLDADSGPARRAELKLTIWQGIRGVLARVPDHASAAILIDRGHERIAAEAADAGVSVAIALEASGHRTLRAEATPSVLGDELRSLRADFGKVLVRWRPDDPESTKRGQIEALREIEELVYGADARLLLELLVPPAPHDTAGAAGGAGGNGAAGDDDARDAGGDDAGGDDAAGAARDADGDGGARAEAGPHWEDFVLPRLQHDSVAEIVGSGIAPTLWKIEGHSNAEAAGALAALVGSARPEASILVLGGGSEIDDLRRVFSCRAGAERFNGFAVGRSIWRGPVEALCRAEITEAQARRMIGDNFLAVIDAFESAARVPTAPAQSC